MDLALGSDTVHVWIAGLELSEGRQQEFWNTLSREEKERAARFRFDHLRRRFVAAHGILRDVLGRYLGTRPESLEFRADTHGKPFLAGPHAGSGVEFNVSDSQDLAAIAVTSGRKVGVDIETLREIPELSAIARRYFTPDERAFIESAHPEQRIHAFLVCWTRKEAYIKAVGRGLSIPLPSFDTYLAPSVAGRSLESADEPRDLRWWLTDLPHIPSCPGAVVVQGSSPEYRYWRWQPIAETRDPGCNRASAWGVECS